MLADYVEHIAAQRHLGYSWLPAGIEDWARSLVPREGDPWEVRKVPPSPIPAPPTSATPAPLTPPTSATPAPLAPAPAQPAPVVLVSAAPAPAVSGMVRVEEEEEEEDGRIGRPNPSGRPAAAVVRAMQTAEAEGTAAKAGGAAEAGGAAAEAEGVAAVAEADRD